ncbi:MAG: hypothetical protein ACKPH7_10625 [Planktothrix sp.]|uniref:hypothetical protein n=1 Tax=Planktothrix sp. TaxID=3088171 RepID=UPI0038D4800F
MFVCLCDRVAATCRHPVTIACQHRNANQQRLRDRKQQGHKQSKGQSTLEINQ